MWQRNRDRTSPQLRRPTDRRTGNNRTAARGGAAALLTAAKVIAGLAYLVISLAPNYIARYLVRTYFQGLAIDASGVETIDINPLRGEINFGPVTFRGAEGETGQVGRIGVACRPTDLW